MWTGAASLLPSASSNDQPWVSHDLHAHPWQIELDLKSSIEQRPWLEQLGEPIPPGTPFCLTTFVAPFERERDMQRGRQNSSSQFKYAQGINYSVKKAHREIAFK